MSTDVWARSRSLPAGLTAVEAARRLPADREFMLVDRVPVDGRPARLLAVGALLRFEAQGDVLTGRTHQGRPLDVPAGPDPLARVFAVLRRLRFHGAPLPAPLRSAFGFLAYESVRGFERLPARHPRIAPDYLLFVPRAVALFDTAGGPGRVYGFGGQPGEAVEVADAVRAELTGPAPAAAAAPRTPPSADLEISASFDRTGFADAVRRAKKYLLEGDIFQVVLSLRWEIPHRGSGLDLYDRLTAVNPSPFQFCYRGPDLSVVGASPEPFVTLAGGRASVRPLAGTRPRGRTPAQDLAFERSLRTSVKETAEHRMLVDLARNDLGRVCRPGTVDVDAVMAVERYSHVMHLVSNVIGEVRDDVSAEQVLRACFPAGTMTGAPKVRAMEIIDELEPVARGLYSGAVGLLAPDELNTFLVIRSAVLRAGRISLQAGAGIVSDSDPDAEYDECLTKLAATAAALGIGSIA